MAFTLTQQPQAYMPAYNPIIYQGLSTNAGISDFYYKVTVTDIISGANAVYQINPRPDGYLLFDVSPFAQNYFINYIPINLYGVQYALQSVRELSVKIDEFYSGALTAGSTYYFRAWNAALSAEDFVDYNYLDYVFLDGSPFSLSVLTDSLNEITYEGRSNYWYYLASETQYLYQTFVVKTYNELGSLLGTTYIEDGGATIINYRYKYIGIDFGYKGMSEIQPSVLLTGDYPIITPAVSYYTVTGSRTNASAVVNLDLLKTYTIRCVEKSPVYTIHALFDKGHFRSVHFPKISEVNINSEKTTYNQIPFENTANVWEYARRSAGEKILSVTETKVIKLRTDWLTEDEIDLYAQLVTAPVSYLDDGGTDYVQVIPIPSSYRKVKKFNKKLYALELDYKYTLKSFKQRG